MSADFVHLHVRSEFAIIDSLIKIPTLIQSCHKDNMLAVSIADPCNLFGLVKFYSKAVKTGIKPIIGSELWLEPETENYQPAKLVFLCQDNIGLQNLIKLITIAYRTSKRDKVPLLTKEQILESSDGLIVLSGAQNGDVGQAILHEDKNLAVKLTKWWQHNFADRYYLEMQRVKRPGEKAFNNKILKLANHYKLPVVATNEVVFLEAADFGAHEARVCIQTGTTLDQTDRQKNYTREQYLKTSEQMVELFADIPQAIQNSVEIAKRCNVTLDLYNSVLPKFPVPKGMSEASYLEQASIEGLELRLAKKFKTDNITDDLQQKIKQQYLERLQIELQVINKMGFPGYFLIVADFIKWAKENHIPVGPGRGSGAGSLVAYSLEITDLDPIDYELLFERFLNPERVSMPDFDIDFCMDNRDAVIDYVATRFGRDSVSQIATFGTMAAKAVIRDVGRVLGHPYGFVDKIAKLIPFEIGMTLDKALEQEPGLAERYKSEGEVKNLINLAKKLEGLTRNVGKHAGGVVIAPSKLTDFVPLYCDENSTQMVTQLDKDDVEAIGLVKFDFLGLRTLTIIDWAVKNANEIREKNNKPPIDINNIPIDDAETFKLLKACATTAVFQLESRGMKDLIKRLQPDQFEEIIALVALFRPGPLQSGMVDDFINRKHKRAKVEYPHPDIEPILEPTYGVILYQEQVMQIAQVLAGYTLGGADLLRRAMGKKKPEEMAKQREIFTKGAIERGVEEETATYIFDLMEKFAGYGFNKSHSAAYALVSYQTAWLKAHFPSAFMAAVLSADMNNTDKLVNLIEECRRSRIKVVPPDINKCQYKFTVNQNGDKLEILYGLGALKGVGEGAIEEIIKIRTDSPYTDIFNFCEKVDLKKINRRVIESLIKAGAFDGLYEDRSIPFAYLDEALKRAEQLDKQRASGQMDLFGSQDTVEINEDITANIKKWTEMERLQGEKDSLGMYITGHPISMVEANLKKIGVKKYRDIKLTNKKETKAMLAGLVISVRSLQTKNGDRMAILLIDDRLDRFEIAVFPEAYKNYSGELVKDALVLLNIKASYDNERNVIKMNAEKVLKYESASKNYAKVLRLSLDPKNIDIKDLDNLKQYLSIQEKGSCRINIEFLHSVGSADIRFSDEWSITPAENTLEEIKQMFNVEKAEFDYG